MNEAEVETVLSKLNRNHNLLPFITLSSKQINPEARRLYLKRVLILFNTDELVAKWKTSKQNIHRFYITNNLPVFEGRNLFEKELNILLDCGSKHGDVRKKLNALFSAYNTKSILSHYKLTYDELSYYCQLFGINIAVDFKTINIDSLGDIPAEYCLTLSNNTSTSYFKKNEEGRKNMSIKTTVDITSGLVLKTEYEQTNLECNIDSKSSATVHREPISIITFMKLSEKERNTRLKVLLNDLNLTNDEIEKILGIPSGEYLRKIKARHLIFDFHSKDKLKTALNKFKTFEDCQKFIIEIIMNKRFKEFNISEDKFLTFASKHFDVARKRDGSCIADDWITFYNKIIYQAIYVYKKNSRVTNLTEQEVAEFEKYHRKEISEKNLIGIIRNVIINLHNDNQSWISIFDFKTAIEKEGFELGSNDRIVNIVDDLIAKKSFKNEYFTLKKVSLSNPILSNESSIRWEFVSTRTPEKVVEKPVEIEKPAVNVTKPVTKPKVVETPKKHVEVAEPEKVVEKPVEIEKPVEKKDFIISNSVSFNFNESNIDEVLDFIKMNFRLFGSGNANLTISKD